MPVFFAGLLFLTQTFMCVICSSERDERGQVRLKSCIGECFHCSLEIMCPKSLGSDQIGEDKTQT